MDEQTSGNFRLFYAISMALQLGFLIVAPVLGFLFLGRWLDGLWGTRPVIMLSGIAAGVAVTGYELYHTLHPLLFPDHGTDRT